MLGRAEKCLPVKKGRGYWRNTQLLEARGSGKVQYGWLRWTGLGSGSPGVQEVLWVVWLQELIGTGFWGDHHQQVPHSCCTLSLLLHEVT
jgi:hypothetical protein